MISLAIARHAVERKFISKDSLPSILENKQKDETPLTPLDQLLGQVPKGEAPTVTVEAKDSREAKEEIQKGVIEDSVKEKNRGKESSPPSVVIDSKRSEGKVRTKNRKKTRLNFRGPASNTHRAPYFCVKLLARIK